MASTPATPLANGGGSGSSSSVARELAAARAALEEAKATQSRVAALQALVAELQKAKSAAEQQQQQQQAATASAPPTVSIPPTFVFPRSVRTYSLSAAAPRRRLTLLGQLMITMAVCLGGIFASVFLGYVAARTAGVNLPASTVHPGYWCMLGLFAGALLMHAAAVGSTPPTQTIMASPSPVIQQHRRTHPNVRRLLKALSASSPLPSTSSTATGEGFGSPAPRTPMQRMPATPATPAAVAAMPATPAPSAPATTAGTPGTTTDGPFAQIDEMDKSGRYREELEALEAQKSDDPEFLWRHARAVYGVAGLSQSTTPVHQAGMQRAMDIAQHAIDAAPNSSNCHKWFAITASAVGNYSAPKVKLHNGLLFRKHTELAIQCSPHDGALHHMLGRWCYEVASVPWALRMAARAFGEVPTSSYREAITYFEKAAAFKPGWLMNHFWYAKALLKEKDTAGARVQLQKALEAPQQSPEDKELGQEAAALLRSL